MNKFFEAITSWWRNLFPPSDLYIPLDRQDELRRIDDYVDDCMSIAEVVFEMPVPEQIKFQDFLYSQLVNNVGNEFNLHDHPLYAVCSWYGIYLGDDPRMDEIHEKFAASGLVLKSWF